MTVSRYKKLDILPKKMYYKRFTVYRSALTDLPFYTSSIKFAVRNADDMIIKGFCCLGVLCFVTNHGLQLHRVPPFSLEIRSALNATSP